MSSPERGERADVRWCDLGGAILGLAPGPLVYCFEDIACESLICARRASRHETENDPVGVVGSVSPNLHPVDRDQAARSKMAAMPWPPPMHIVSSP